jgi:hypothetical protein
MRQFNFAEPFDLDFLQSEPLLTAWCQGVLVSHVDKSWINDSINAHIDRRNKSYLERKTLKHLRETFCKALISQ